MNAKSLCALVLALSACANSADEVPPCEPPSITGAVRREGGLLMDASNKSVTLNGVNSYPLLDHAGRNNMEAIHQIFTRAKALGRGVVRTNAFMEGGNNPARIREDSGAMREEGLVALDRVIAAAEEDGVRLILVLGNHWDDYGGANAVIKMVAASETLPREAFYTDPRVIAAQSAYMQAIVSRRNSINSKLNAENETIVAWELHNEARCDDDEFCSDSTLWTWAKTMSDAVRAANATQPIAWGGAGYIDDLGENFERIATLGGIDVMTLHLYPQLNDSAVRADTRNIYRGIVVGCDAIAERAEIAKSLRIPFIVEEGGWQGSDDERAQVLGGWSMCAVDAGVAFLPWMIAEPNRTDFDGYLIDTAIDAETVAAITCETPTSSEE